MAKTRQYSRSRRVLMQVTLGSVLAATTGLAAYIGHSYAVERRVTLGPAQPIGDLVVRVPENWSRARVVTQGYGTVFTEPSSNHTRRKIIIQQMMQNSPRLSAAELLTGNLEVGPGIRIEPFTLMGQPGVVANVGPFETSLGEVVDPGLYAAAVFPDGFAVIIKITSADILGPSNRKLLRQITESMERRVLTGEMI